MGVIIAFFQDDGILPTDRNELNSSERGPGSAVISCLYSDVLSIGDPAVCDIRNIYKVRLKTYDDENCNFFKTFERF